MSSYLKLDSSDNTYIMVPNADWPGTGSLGFAFRIWCRFSDTAVN